MLTALYATPDKMEHRIYMARRFYALANKCPEEDRWKCEYNELMELCNTLLNGQPIPKDTFQRDFISVKDKNFIYAAEHITNHKPVAPEVLKKARAGNAIFKLKDNYAKIGFGTAKSGMRRLMGANSLAEAAFYVLDIEETDLKCDFDTKTLARCRKRLESIQKLFHVFFKEQWIFNAKDAKAGHISFHFPKPHSFYVEIEAEFTRSNFLTEEISNLSKIEPLVVYILDTIPYYSKKLARVTDLP